MADRPAQVRNKYEKVVVARDGEKDACERVREGRERERERERRRERKREFFLEYSTAKTNNSF